MFIYIGTNFGIINVVYNCGKIARTVIAFVKNSAAGRAAGKPCGIPATTSYPVPNGRNKTA